MSVALGLLTDETYSLNDAWAQRPPAQYVRSIMRYDIKYNIVDIANQLSFAYQSLASELQVFISPPTKSTKVADFICTLEEKQEVWHEMMTTSAGPQRYYNPAQRPSPYKSPLPSQSEAFSCYQSQYRGPVPQQSWRLSKQGFDRKPPLPPPQRQYTQQPFCQTFMPQHQNYPYSQCQKLSPTAANWNSALQTNLLAPFNSEAPDNLVNRNAPH